MNGAELYYAKVPFNFPPDKNKPEHVRSGEIMTDVEAAKGKLADESAKLFRHRAQLLWDEGGFHLSIVIGILFVAFCVWNHPPFPDGFEVHTSDRVMITLIGTPIICLLAFGGYHIVFAVRIVVQDKYLKIKDNWTPYHLKNRIERHL